jgi:hypothetical protein
MESKVLLNDSSGVDVSYENLSQTMLINSGAFGSDYAIDSHFTEAIYVLAEILSEMNLQFLGKTQ